MYDGFRIHCGCPCSNCGRQTTLEGYSDAYGSHYCPHCDDYVHVVRTCSAQTQKEVERREEIIKANNAYD